MQTMHTMGVIKCRFIPVTKINLKVIKLPLIRAYYYLHLP